MTTRKPSKPLVERQRDAYRELAEALDHLVAVYRTGPAVGPRGHLRVIDRVTRARERVEELEVEAACS